MKSGCYTALVTPFLDGAVDNEGLEKLVDFQIVHGITGILAVGTTGESPTLSWNEHIGVIEDVAKKTKGKCGCIAGTGSNNTEETLDGTRHAAEAGADAVLLVDPYYNGPSSLEIRKEYVAPVARSFPDIEVIPYVIPGRTGAQLLPEDLAILFGELKNVNTVKEATGNLDNMKRTRKCCGPDYQIMSGDDGLTFKMMTDPDIKAGGAISVISNIAPAAVGKMVSLASEGQTTEAEKLASALNPLFDLVTVSTTEETTYGSVVCRARNPLGIKTLMTILGMPSGGCRKPLGKMSEKGLNKVLAAARQVHGANPEILEPAGTYFGVDIGARLENPENWKGLAYESY